MKTNEARSLIQTRPKDINRVKLLLLPLLCLLGGGVVGRLKFFESELINLMKWAKVHLRNHQQFHLPLSSVM